MNESTGLSLSIKSFYAKLTRRSQNKVSAYFILASPLHVNEASFTGNVTTLQKSVGSHDSPYLARWSPLLD
jgi:hypothetical protein